MIPRPLEPDAPAPSLPQPPAHLGEEGRRFFAQIVEGFDLEPADLAVLTSAAESLDRAAQARVEVERLGVLVEDRSGGVKANPACGIERDSRIAFLRALRQLGLDAAPTSASEPPRLVPLRGNGRS